MISGYKYEWRIKSEPYLIPPTIREVLTSLDNRIPISAEERGDLKLIFHELLFNAVLHGNQSDTDKNVHIRLAVGSRFICASITDEGPGFNCKSCIEESEQPESIDKESGRGMKLVMSLADEVLYSANGKQVTFIKRIGYKNG